MSQAYGDFVVLEWQLAVDYDVLESVGMGDSLGM